MPQITLAHLTEPIFLLTQDDLPYDDGIPMETQRHKWQMDLLIDELTTWLDAREDDYVNGNMFVYLAQAKNQDFKGPDFFAVVGVPKRERKSWVVWEEGKAPDVVVDLLSPSTAQHDKTERKEIYQDELRVSEYFGYDPFNIAIPIKNETVCQRPSSPTPFSQDWEKGSPKSFSPVGRGI